MSPAAPPAPAPKGSSSPRRVTAPPLATSRARASSLGCPASLPSPRPHLQACSMQRANQRRFRSSRQCMTPPSPPLSFARRLSQACLGITSTQVTATRSHVVHERTEDFRDHGRQEEHSTEHWADELPHQHPGHRDLPPCFVSHAHTNIRSQKRAPLWVWSRAVSSDQRCPEPGLVKIPRKEIFFFDDDLSALSSLG